MLAVGAVVLLGGGGRGRARRACVGAGRSPRRWRGGCALVVGALAPGHDGRAPRGPCGGRTGRRSTASGTPARREVDPGGGRGAGRTGVTVSRGARHAVRSARRRSQPRVALPRFDSCSRAGNASASRSGRGSRTRITSSSASPTPRCEADPGDRPRRGLGAGARLAGLRRCAGNGGRARSAVVETAYHWSALPTRRRIHVEVDDGRRYLQRHDDRYDVTMLDAFYADGVPFHCPRSNSRAPPRPAHRWGRRGQRHWRAAGSRLRIMRALWRRTPRVPTVVLDPVYEGAFDRTDDVRNIILVATERAAGAASSSPRPGPRCGGPARRGHPR